MDLLRTDVTGDNGGKERAAIANNQHLLRAGNLAKQQIFERLGRHVVPGAEHDQVLDTPGNSPVSVRVDLALVAGMKPATPQRIAGGLRAVPVSREKIGTANQNFSVVAE